MHTKYNDVHYEVKVQGNNYFVRITLQNSS